MCLDGPYRRLFMLCPKNPTNAKNKETKVSAFSAGIKASMLFVTYLSIFLQIYLFLLQATISQPCDSLFSNIVSLQS